MNFLRRHEKSNDVEEFGNLIEHHLDGLFATALRLTRHRAQAEDLVQDTVVRALRFRDRFESGTNFKAWIYTVLTNLFIQRYRRGKREREILDGQSRVDVSRQLTSNETRVQAQRPESLHFDRLLSDDVVQALDSLPEEFRTVVLLCDIEGLGYKEIAEAIGRPVGTVMSRLYRGRRLLEEKLAKLAHEHGIIKAEDLPASQSAEGAEILEMTGFRRRKGG